ncbi:hypothetical protein JIN85_14830 [Luteolibacter pohnpeiensis]|uniref:Uncharacterized protein n=1 Tax=Luteolibacter pohnpeiensis TaxID=454153 RepID=A0A934S5Y0_9BACT|nr:hypothetical protein [Luteolibacter pohnpeiensis]MBK1883690.1 hypothetical protein [Luteolibacter pohnpeiensis]
MKSLKVYDDVHRDIKVEAARSGRTTTNLASELMRAGLKAVKAGKLKLGKVATPSPKIKGGVN